MKLFDFFKKKEVKQELEKVEETEECEHDWEIVEFGNYWLYYGNSNDNKPIIIVKEEPTYIISSHIHYIQSENRVCIKCGKCYNGIKIAEEFYKLQEKKKRLKKREERRRKIFAKQLWEDGCKNNGGLNE